MRDRTSKRPKTGSCKRLKKNKMFISLPFPMKKLKGCNLVEEFVPHLSSFSAGQESIDEEKGIPCLAHFLRNELVDQSKCMKTLSMFD